MMKMCIPRQNIYSEVWNVEYQDHQDGLSKKNLVCLFATLIHPCISLENSFQSRTLVVKVPVNGYFKMDFIKLLTPLCTLPLAVPSLPRGKKSFLLYPSN